MRSIIATLLLTPAIAWAGAVDPAALLARIARPAPASTAFVEVRFSSLLATPLVVAGELQYRSADALGKRIDHPYHEQMEISGGDVTVIREEESPRHFSLKRVPELRGMLSAFGALLSGDQSALERYFTLGLTGDDLSWALVLTPRDAKVRKRLREVVVTGRADTPRCLTVTETDGDASVMLLGDTGSGNLPDPLDLTGLDRLCRKPEH